MILPIYVYGSEVLREVAEEVDVEKADKEELPPISRDSGGQ